MHLLILQLLEQQRGLLQLFRIFSGSNGMLTFDFFIKLSVFGVLLFSDGALDFVLFDFLGLHLPCIVICLLPEWGKIAIVEFLLLCDERFLEHICKDILFGSFKSFLLSDTISFDLDHILSQLFISLLIDFNHAFKLLLLELLISLNFVCHTSSLINLLQNVIVLFLKHFDSTLDGDCIFISFFARVYKSSINSFSRASLIC